MTSPTPAPERLTGMHWHCDHCGKTDPVEEPYGPGDQEPCSDCGKGVSRVMSLQAGAAMEQLRALGWTPPIHYSDDRSFITPDDAAKVVTDEMVERALSAYWGPLDSIGGILTETVTPNHAMEMMRAALTAALTERPQ